MQQSRKKVFIISRCSWTLYKFRYNLIRELINRNIDVCVAGQKDEYSSFLEELGVRFVSVSFKDAGVNPIKILYILWILYRWYSRDKPDAVHHFTIKPIILGNVAAFFSRIPKVINTVTGLGYAFTNHRVIIAYMTGLLYKSAMKPSHIVFFQNSDDMSYFLKRKIIPDKKARMIGGSGVDIAHFNCVEDKPVSDARRTTFLMISRLLKDKGIYEFHSAASIVKQKNPETKFVIVGGEDRHNPSAITKKLIQSWKLEGLVQFVDYVDDVREFIAESDVVVLPSYREGMPKSLLEACAMCKPVIASDVPGCRELVKSGRNGILIPVKDSDALAIAMLFMIDNPAIRKNMGMVGRDIVVDRYNEKKIIDQTISEYGLTI